MYTDGLDLANFSELTISYSIYAVSMETNEDFFVEVNVGGGWQVVANYAAGVHFNNNTRYSDAITVTGTFSSATTIRFRCDASNNADRIYIDDVVLTGCVNSITNGITGDITPSSKDLISNADNFEVIETVEEIDNSQEATPMSTLLEATEVKLFPNPTTGVLNILHNMDEEASVEIKVYNNVGQLMINQRGVDAASNIKLDVSSLSSGNYFITIQSGEEVSVGKFVKY